MTLPLAEHEINALEKRKKELSRAGFEVPEVNSNYLLPGLSALNWQDLLQASEPIPGQRFLKVLLSFSDSPNMTPERLADLSRQGLGWDLALRNCSAQPICGGHRPVAPELLEKRLNRFFEWAASPAFLDLQPILQLTLTQLRLFEMLPFARSSEMLCFWFGAIPLIGAGHLIPAYTGRHFEQLGLCLSQGLDFSTGPLVGLNLDAALRSYELVQELR